MAKAGGASSPSQASPICPYCTKPAAYHASSAGLYNGRDYGPAWVCAPCQAWVGTDRNGKPLGRLANKRLRQAKMRAHAAFDPLWQAKMLKDGMTKGRARGKGYKWLAAQLGIPPKDCHIALFDVDLCERVVEVCGPWQQGAANVTLRSRGDRAASVTDESRPDR